MAILALKNELKHTLSSNYYRKEGIEPCCKEKERAQIWSHLPCSRGETVKIRDNFLVI